MTETFPFAPAAEDQQVAPPTEESAGGRQLDRRKIAMAGGLLAVVVAGGAYLLLGGSGDSSTDAFTPTVPHRTASAPAGPGTAATTPAPAPSPLAKYSGQPAGHDPFKPLVTAPPPPQPSQSAAPPAAPSAVPPVVGGTGGQPATGTGTGTGSGTGTGTATPPPVQKTVLIFRSVGTDKDGITPTVTVTFNGKDYTLKAGDTVAGMAKVVSILPDDNVAVFQLGDQTFDLHVGQAYVNG